MDGVGGVWLVRRDGWAMGINGGGFVKKKDWEGSAKRK